MGYKQDENVRESTNIYSVFSQWTCYCREDCYHTEKVKHWRGAERTKNTELEVGKRGHPSR